MSQEKEVMVSEEQQEVTEAKFDGAVADGSSLGSVEDLGGPTPTNNKPDDESNKLKTPSQTQASAPKTKPSDASPKKHESVEAENAEGDELIEIDLSADVAALTEGEDLSEEFKAKAATIFEAAVVSRLNEELKRMHEDYAKVLEEEIDTVKTDLAEKVDEYLTYAVTQWMEKNTLAVESGIKQEMATSVLDGIKQVFVENFIDLPDEKVDVVDSLQGQLENMESKLNESIEENVELQKRVGNYIKNGIVTEISEGLSLAQREKLVSLAEAVEFNDEESFREKVSTLRESYFSTKPEATTVSEDVEVENAPTGAAMSAYAAAISRWSGK